MIKHILTEEAVLIPSTEGIIQIQKSHKKFDKIMNSIMNTDSVSNIMKYMNRFSYEDDEISISQDKNEKIEIFYNGKYIDLDERMNVIFKRLMSLDDGFELSYGAAFLKKLLKNRYYSLNTMFDILFSNGFAFTANGNIIIAKEYEEESNRFYPKVRSFANRDFVKVSLAVVDPSTLDQDMNFFYYHVIGHLITKNSSEYLKSLTGTYIGNVNKYLTIKEDILKLANTKAKNEPGVDNKALFVNEMSMKYAINIQPDLDLQEMIESITRQIKQHETLEIKFE